VSGLHGCPIFSSANLSNSALFGMQVGGEVYSKSFNLNLSGIGLGHLKGFDEFCEN
jgi:hypothetical protein